MGTQKPPSNQVSGRLNEPSYSLGKSVIQAFKNEAHQIPQEILKQITGQGNNRGEIRPGEAVNPQEQKNKEIPSQESTTVRYYQGQLEKEKFLRKQEKQEIKIRIRALRKEIIKISQSVQELKKEAAIAIIQETPDPGEYHLNFLENLLQFLISLRQKIEEGDTWLSAFNQRSKKRNYFWRQVKKSGAKFLLSSDRTPATQMG